MMIKRPLYDAFRDLVSFVEFKKREDTHGGVLLLEPTRVFLTFFSLYKWYQIAQNFQGSQCSPTLQLQKLSTLLCFVALRWMKWKTVTSKSAWNYAQHILIEADNYLYLWIHWKNSEICSLNILRFRYKFLPDRSEKWAIKQQDVLDSSIDL